MKLTNILTHINKPKDENGDTIYCDRNAKLLNATMLMLQSMANLRLMVSDEVAIIYCQDYANTFFNNADDAKECGRDFAYHNKTLLEQYLADSYIARHNEIFSLFHYNNILTDNDQIMILPNRDIISVWEKFIVEIEANKRGSFNLDRLDHLFVELTVACDFVTNVSKSIHTHQIREHENYRPPVLSTDLLTKMWTAVYNFSTMSHPTILNEMCFNYFWRINRLVKAYVSTILLLDFSNSPNMEYLKYSNYEYSLSEYTSLGYLVRKIKCNKKYSQINSYSYLPTSAVICTTKPISEYMLKQKPNQINIETEAYLLGRTQMLKKLSEQASG
jgi:hypothetical protein